MGKMCGRTLVWDICMQGPDSQHKGGSHANAHSPVAALALLGRLIHLEDGPEGLINAFVLQAAWTCKPSDQVST